MASISVRDYGEDWVEVRVSGMSSGVATINLYYARSSTSTNTYETSIGSSQFTKSGSTYRYDYTFEGLRSGTEYRFTVNYYNSSGGNPVDQDSCTQTTLESGYEQDIIYHSGSSTYTQTISGSGTLKTGSIFTPPTGFTLYGWATRVNTTTITYEAGQTYVADSSDDLDLYAVWQLYRPDGVTFYYGVNKEYTNTRNLLAWAYNSSSTRQTTGVESVLAPKFSTSNQNITVLDRTFTAIGWRNDTTASGSVLSAGGTYVTPSGDATFYAVYQNTDGIRVYYNANGGSGTMASATVSGTLYYNTAGNNTRLTVTPRANEFTPPTGKQFEGWSTSVTGSLVTSVTTAYNITFYAQWISARPKNWSWSGYLTLNNTRTAYNMTAGGKPPMVQQSDGSYYAYYMGAAEWNSFIDRIEEFASYLGLELYFRDINGAQATAGQQMKKSQAQCVVNMLMDLDPPTSPPSVPNTITVSFFHGIRDSLNSIP